MATAWASGLPNYLLIDGAAEVFGGNRIRSPMDVGPPKLRRRSTSAPTSFAGSMFLTTAQAATFETFYKTTLAHGTLPFTWYHPRTRASVDMTFVGDPELIPQGGGEWLLNLTVEILP